ncbi:MAG TPA: pilus assembly protein HicB [Rhodoblastus sp.]|nr:pilus assembly protein HicB [Rhodoblastus sp.]
MSRTSYPLKLPASIKSAAQRLAREDGVSLNQWISVAVAQKVGAVETAADFFKHRARGSTPSDLLPFLDRAGSEPPPVGDEWPRAQTGRRKRSNA